MMTPTQQAIDTAQNVDQLASMFSILRDRYAFRGTVLQILVLAASFFTFTLSIAADRLLLRIGLDPEGARDWMGLLSGVVVFAAIVDMRLDYRGRAALLDEGAKRLYDLKGLLRAAVAHDKITAQEMDALREQYAEVTKMLPGLPEGQFLPLKAAHQRKRRLSALVSSYPGTPLWILRLRLWIDGASRWPRLAQGASKPDREDMTAQPVSEAQPTSPNP
jgi:hypothetical protein